MTSEIKHEIKSAAEVLADDVICQSFIQSSSTLAYACLLIRQRKYDLAAHVLHSLEAKQASRFKDMVFYLQAQIGIETGEFAMVKKRLVPRVHQHPNDMVALSLLECAIYLEWMEWAESAPQPETSAPERASAPVDSNRPIYSNSTFGNPEAAAAAAYAEAYGGPIAEPAFPGSGMFGHVNHFAQPQPPPEPDSGMANDTPLSGILEAKAPSAASQIPVPAPQRSGTPPHAEAAAKPKDSGPPQRIPAAQPSGRSMGDVGIYQPLVNDANTHAVLVWNASKGNPKSACRGQALEPLVAMLSQELPGSLQDACTALESGPIQKICYSFQNLTVTSFHSGAENLSVVTGNISQSLLTIVRAENTFRKQAFSLAQGATPLPQAPGAGPAFRSAEYSPDE